MDKETKYYLHSFRAFETALMFTQFLYNKVVQLAQTLLDL